MTTPVPRSPVNWTYKRTVLLLCMLAFFATMVARLVISPVVPDITAAFEVTNSDVGLALTGMWLTYALAQFPSGVLGDRFGNREVILAAVGLTALTSALLAVSPSFSLFVVFTAMLGAGAGLHYSVASALLANEHENVGVAIGIHNAGAPLAGLLAPISAVYVLNRFGWRYSIALGAVAAIPVFLAFSSRVRRTPPSRPDQPMADRFKFEPIVELLTRPPIAFTTALAVLSAFTWQATASFLPTFLVEYQGRSQGFAGAAFSAYFVVHGGVQPILGGISERYGRDGVLLFCMITAVTGYWLLLVGTDLATTAVAILLVGIGMSWIAVLVPRFMDNLSDAERGVGFGLVRTVYMVLSSLGSVTVGTIADGWGWGVSFALLIALLVVVFLSLLANWAFDLGY